LPTHISSNDGGGGLRR